MILKIYLLSFISLFQIFCLPNKLILEKENYINADAIKLSENKNRLYTEKGYLELNLVYYKNNETFFFDFAYFDQDWIYLDSVKSFMFLFKDSNYYFLDTKVKTKYFQDKTNKMFKAYGRVGITDDFIDKIANQKIYGLRINGRYKFIEYELGIGTMQLRWKKMIYGLRNNKLKI